MPSSCVYKTETASRHYILRTHCHCGPSAFLESESESESYVTTDGQPACLSWNKAPIWDLRPDLYYLCDSYGLVLVGRPL
jgi:hypothetical protein